MLDILRKINALLVLFIILIFCYVNFSLASCDKNSREEVLEEINAQIELGTLASLIRMKKILRDCSQFLDRRLLMSTYEKASSLLNISPQFAANIMLLLKNGQGLEGVDKERKVSCYKEYFVSTDDPLKIVSNLILRRKGVQKIVEDTISSQESKIHETHVLGKIFNYFKSALLHK